MAIVRPWGQSGSCLGRGGGKGGLDHHPAHVCRTVQMVEQMKKKWVSSRGEKRNGVGRGGGGGTNYHAWP